MDRTFWHKQTADQPLFPNLLWSRPENKRQAGKLLIVGGNAHGFAAAAEAYAAAEKAGVGTARVLLPNSLQKTVGKVFATGEYAPSTPSGSFSQQALAELLELSKWADAVLLAGDFGHNSETAVLLEKFIQSYKGQLTLSQDAVDYFLSISSSMLARSETLLVVEFAQLQKLAQSARFPQAFTSNMDLLRLIDTLHNFTRQYATHIIVNHLENTVVAVNGQISTTKLNQPPSLVATAAHATVWWLQNPTKPFEAMTIGII